MKSIESFQLQRLVDGELDIQETRKLLLQADSIPGAWRLVASTFVENQIMARGFKAASAFDESPVLAPVVRSVPGSRRFYVQSLALAASLVLAVSLGFLVGRSPFHSGVKIAGDDRESSPIAVTDSPLLNSAPLAQAVPGSTEEDLTPAVYHMTLEDPAGNEYMDSEIPLYPISQNNELDRIQYASMVPESIRQHANQSGYQINHDVHYLSGRMKDGRRFVIPVNNYQLSPTQ